MKFDADKNTGDFPHGHIDRSNWKRVRLGDMLHPIKSRNTSHSQPANVRIVTQGDDELSLINETNYYTPKQKTILFGDHTCKVKLIESSCHLLGDGIKLLTSVNDKYDTLFIYHLASFLVQRLPQGYARHLASFLALYDFVPAYEEQLHMASALSSCDKHILSLQSLIAKYEAIKKATVNLLLKPKEGWRQIKLGAIGDVFMCKRILKSQTTETGDVPFYKIGTFGKTPDAYISRSLFEDFKSRFSYPKIGDILLSAAGTIGRTVVFNGEDAYFQDSNIVWIDNDECNVTNSFLHATYNQIDWQTENGGTVSRLYNDNIRNATISVPSIGDQKRIVGILDSIDRTIDGLKTQLAKARNIKHGMMSCFFG